MRFYLLLLFTLFLTSCSTSHGVRATAANPDESAHSDELVIVATSDFHATLDKAEGLASVVRDLKKRYGEQMIYLDGGDLFQGSLEGNMNKGRSIVKFFNLIGLDAAAIGNHELDYGPDVIGRTQVKPGEDGMGNLKARVAEAKYAWLSSNLVRNKTGKSIFKAHAVFNRANRKVCVIGGTTPTTANITNPHFIKGFHFEPLKKAVLREVNHLRGEENCDVVILTSHAGLQCNAEQQCQQTGDLAEIMALLTELPPGTLDAVVAGHTHLRAQEIINGTPVIEAGIGAKQVGVLHLKGTHNQWSTRFDPFIDVPSTAVQADVTELLKPYRDAAFDLKAQIVGHASAPLARDYWAENPTANLVADVIRNAGAKAGGAQFSLVNAGGVRSALPSGTLTYGDAFKVLPFDNSLSIVTLKGSELRLLVEITLSGGHGLGAISGLHVKRLNLAPGERGTWDRDLNHDGKKEDWERATIIEITDDKGRPIDDQKTYKLATLDFLIAGGNHLNTVFDHVPATRKQFFQGFWIIDLFVDYLKHEDPISPDSHFTPNSRRVELVTPNK